MIAVKILLIILCSPIILLVILGFLDMIEIIDFDMVVYSIESIFIDKLFKEKKVKKKKLKEIVAELQDRVDVLEFKEKAKGERILQSCADFKFLSSDGKKVICVPEFNLRDFLYINSYFKVKGNYIEELRYGYLGWDKIIKVYTIKNDELVSVDKDTYLKAKKFDSMKAELKDKINV